jgi:hypothetical protein
VTEKWRAKLTCRSERATRSTDVARAEIVWRSRRRPFFQSS